MDKLQCEFSIVRYVPHPLRGEFINIGIVIRQRSGPVHPAFVAFTRDWSRVLALDPHADVEMLQSIEEDLRARIAVEKGSADHLMEVLEETLSLGLQVSKPQAALTEDLKMELDRLLSMYVI